MLAVTQARRFAAAGKATLLCCYNKGLAHWLAGTLTEAESQRITVRHFHALAHEWCERAGMEFAHRRFEHTPLKFAQAKIRAAYSKYPGHQLVAGLLPPAYVAASLIAKNKLVFYARTPR